MSTRLPIIAIIGPTGAGKSNLGISLAKNFGGEIISVDSIRVYRDVNVISGATSLDKTTGITHHGLSCLSAADEPINFITFAIRTIQAIHKRGLIPILCGGSISLTEALLFHPFVEQLDLFVISLSYRLDTLGILTDARIDRMVQHGLFEEIQRLYQMEKSFKLFSTTNRGAWKAIGYAEMRACCETVDPVTFRTRFRHGVEMMKENTRAYCRLQLDRLWWRILPGLFQRQRDFCVINVDPSQDFVLDVEIPIIEKCKRWLGRAAKSGMPLRDACGINNAVEVTCPAVAQ